MSEDRNLIRKYIKEGDLVITALMQKHKKKPSKQNKLI